MSAAQCAQGGGGAGCRVQGGSHSYLLRAEWVICWRQSSDGAVTRSWEEGGGGGRGGEWGSDVAVMVVRLGGKGGG